MAKKKQHKLQIIRFNSKGDAIGYFTSEIDPEASFVVIPVTDELIKPFANFAAATKPLDTN